MDTAARVSPYQVALEGVFGGAFGLGSGESYAGWVGIDTNAYMELNRDWDWTSESGNALDGGFLERPDQDYQTFYLNPRQPISVWARPTSAGRATVAFPYPLRESAQP